MSNFINRFLTAINSRNHYSKFFLLFLFFSLLYLSFQAKSWKNINGDIYGWDDESYYTYASSIINDFDYDLDNNGFKVPHYSPLTGKVVSYHPIGTGILIAPFYAVAKPFVLLSSWIRGEDFDQRHPIFFIFMISGIAVYAFMGSLILLRALKQISISDSAALWAVSLGFWGSFIPVYIFKRPIFTHIPEFFLISLLIYFLLTIKTIKISTVLTLGIVSGLLLITRWNDIHVLCFVIYLILFKETESLNAFCRRLFFLLFFLCVVFFVFFLTQCQAWKIFNGSYFKPSYNPVGSNMDIRVLFSLTSLKNLMHILVGKDWGIIYTMFPAVLGVVCLFKYCTFKISSLSILERTVYSLLFAFPFLVVLSWKQQGSFYGYRHLLSCLPFAIVGMGSYFNKLKSIKVLRILCLLLMFANFLVILPFEYVPSTNLSTGITEMGGVGWVNNEYFVNSLKVYFELEPKAFVGMFMRGYFGAYVLGSLSLLAPDVFLNIATEKVVKYYALNTFSKQIVLIYPIVFVLLIVLTYFIFKYCIFKGEDCNERS